MVHIVVVNFISPLVIYSAPISYESGNYDYEQFLLYLRDRTVKQVILESKGSNFLVHSWGSPALLSLM